MFVNFERFLPKRKKNGQFGFRAKMRAKKSYVSPFPIPPYFPKTTPLSPHTSPQILICNFICVNNLYYQDAVFKTPFSYVQNLYQNTMKILTTETKEHI